MRNTALISVVLSLLLIAAFYWWFSPSWGWLGVYALIAAVASLTVPILYRLAGFTRADEIDWLERRESDEHDAMLADLTRVRRELDALNIREGVRQSDMLTSILDDYHSVIESRFRGKPKSPLAYLSTARRVQRHALQNLNDMVATGHSLSSISRHDQDSRRNSTADSRSHDDTDDDGDSYHAREAEIQTETDPDRVSRLQNMDVEQRQRLQELLSENQQLFDALTDTAVEVANIRSFSDYERLDTLARLVSLAEIASHSGK